MQRTGFVQALVSEPAIKAPDVAVLHGPPWLDQDVSNAMALRPADEGPAGELWPVVCPDGSWVASEPRGQLQQPDHVLTVDAVVHCNVHRLVAEVIGHGQALQASSVGQAVADEVHAPNFIDLGGHAQRCALGRRPAHLLAFAHGKVGIAVQPVYALVIDSEEVSAQQVVHAPISEATACMRDLYDLGLEHLRLGADRRFVAVALSAQSHKPAVRTSDAPPSAVRRSAA